MGRVAKYKKIKAADPYSKKNGGRINLQNVGIWGLGDDGRKAKKRSRRSENLRLSRRNGRPIENSNGAGFDLPPSKHDEFDFKDITGSVKRQKLTNPLAETKEQDLFSANRVKVNGNTATIPKTEQDERKAARILNVKEEVKRETEKKEAKKYARMEGESKNAYKKRTMAETRQIIKQTSESKNEEKLQKKRDFLKNKKKSKKKGNSGIRFEEDFTSTQESDNNDTFVTGERAIAMVDEVRFGEQAERPPVFHQLPRGAKKSVAMGAKKKKKLQAEGMTKEDVEAESKAMELMRRKIQAQYNAVKAKRRRAGDFHL